MSFESLADAFAYVQAHEDITSNEVLVLLALANHKNADQAVAYPSIAGLRKTTKLARRTIQYALRGLEAKKVVETIRTHRRDAAIRRHSLYLFF
jgi:DNA-binding MarR family transcriptional regulator